MICTLGDLLLDVIVRLDGPIAEDTDTYGRTRVGAGGQAANVAAWVVALGGRARFLGKRAPRPGGPAPRRGAGGRGVELAGPEVEAGTGTVVSIATPDGAQDDAERPRRLDRASRRRSSTRLARRLRVAARARLQPRALAAAGDALWPQPRRRRGSSVDLSSTAAIEAFGVDAFRESAVDARPQVVFANEAEAELVGEVDAPTLVIKRGARGCIVVDADGERRAGLRRGARSSTRPARATPSPPASSSAARARRSTRPPAASRRWGRCP